MSTDHERIERARAMWRDVGEDRPPFAVTSAPGQQSVWDYPRPPRLAPDAREVLITSPPTFYIPAADVHTDLLEAAEGSSHCESPDLVGPFKGEPGSHGW